MISLIWQILAMRDPYPWRPVGHKADALSKSNLYHNDTPGIISRLYDMGPNTFNRLLAYHYQPEGIGCTRRQPSAVN